MGDKEKKKQVKKDKNPDRKAAYLLIAPSLLLILVIAIYPVIQSFYFSLFDLRLNSPTKSSVHLDYSINLDTYLQYYPFLVDDLDSTIEDTSGPVKEGLTDVKEDLESLDQNIQEDTGKTYEEVNNILNNFETPSSELAMVDITNETADQFEETIKEINTALTQLKGTDEIENFSEIQGLASGLQGAIIEPNFIGFQHYQNQLTDPRMWSSLWTTVYFTIISVAIEFVLGLAIALLINKAFFGRGLIRATVLIPWAIPTAVSAMMWKFLYDGQNGIVSKFFMELGIIDSMSTLLSTNFGAMSSVILSEVWKTTPYIALLLLAGLQVIPKSLYEAASIDGAGKWKQFIHITMPMLRLSILVAVLFRTLDAFRVFDLIYVLTGGGPANSTETISILAYKVMFAQTNFGAGSALAVIVFICVAIISMIFVKVLGSDLLPENQGK
ncbi:carbohydrate ABC transporter permease [Thalassobacillus pellis]|uniref:carbohydrate ABC transporter permease n=1 Tax=Thalassobacillus pellis TaxID=748008 RepID=UPI001961F135|nr:sugar ABC transporter permease [Thalassobacillus pellis]MBM7553536.1 multiple sugar transport system permease protein [Thalassobacillus pellis]